MRIRASGPAIIVLLLASLPGCTDQGHETEEPHLSRSYLGWETPDTLPQLFAPEIISTGNSERCLSFSPDGRELYYQIGFQSPTTIIVQRRYEDGGWTAAEPVTFSGSSSYNDIGPVLSKDGNTLFFYSNRPLAEGGEIKPDYDFWLVGRTLEGWSKPRNLGPPINSPHHEEDISTTIGGTVYFSSDRDGGYDIYRSEYEGESYGEPERLGPAVNSEFFEGHPCIAPDEGYLVFSSGRRPDDRGDADLYISFRRPDGTWTESVNMGDKINTVAHEAAPTLSPDGRYLFFTSQRERNSDVYWVDIGIIEGLRPADL
jgi:Tol biopolymer transport system component